VWLVVVGIAVIWKVKRQRRDAQVSGVPEAASETTRMSERS
jgi:hypothetical protein